MTACAETSLWVRDARGGREFSGGKESWREVGRVARDCRVFAADVEEEQIAEEEQPSTGSSPTPATSWCLQAPVPGVKPPSA